MNNKADLKQYSTLINKIGVFRLLNLPKQYKEALKEEKNLKNKIKILHFIDINNIW